jgi:hypothetical protein
VEPLRKGRGEHPAADLCPHDREALHVIDIQRRQNILDALIEAVLSEEVPIRVRSGCEAAGTETPRSANPEIISPMEAFLPPTSSTSLFLSCSKGMM